MLSFVFVNTEGQRFILSPLSATIRMDEDVPADSLYAVFAYMKTGELVRVSVYDGERVVFLGVVDEQEHLLSQKGRFLRVSARSLASHLLDNEAMPQCYDHPSASLIYERHVKPYGIARESEDDAVYFGEQQVTKGMSQWAVLKNFCNACYSSSPRITADGVLHMKGLESENSVVFSDAGDGIAYIELNECKKRCEEISRVNVKVEDGEGYRYLLEHTDAIRRGVRRERYLNAVLAATPMTCADAMLHRAQAASYEMQLRCAGNLLGLMGNGATVKNQLLGEKSGLYISGISYRLNKDGDITMLRLKRR